MNIPPPPRTAKAAACCACKHQRRRCTSDCPLASYFPPEKARDFQNVHKLFGVSNIVKLLTEIPEQYRPDAVKSIVYEANAWQMYPATGCAGIIFELQKWLLHSNEELDGVMKLLAMFKQEPVNVNYQPGWDLDCDSTSIVNVNYQTFELDNEMFYKNLNFAGEGGSSSNQLCNYNNYNFYNFYHDVDR